VSLRRISLTVLAALLGVYAIAYVDLVLRARSAYYEGEKYLLWNKSPELKAAHFNAILAEKEKNLAQDFKSGKMTDKELDERRTLSRYERDQAVSESSLKYAYVWFQTAVELFSPPESKWVVLSRVKMAEAKQLWKEELGRKKIPYQDYMLE
jgi:hypothetical protein